MFKIIPANTHLQSLPMWRELHARYTDYRTQLNVAEQFIAHCSPLPDGAGLVLQARPDTDYWFVGDIHGHFDSLLNIICHAVELAQHEGTHPHLIILGDCIDRAEGDFATLALIQAGLMQHHHDAFTLTYVCGNHDFALGVKPNGYFYSAVSPADTANHLNVLSKQGRAADALMLGKAILELARVAPYMGELITTPQGDESYIFAHACTPHTDNQDELREFYTQPPVFNPYANLPDSLLFPCRDDFLRGLLHPQQAHVSPHRGFLATTQGAEDMAAYFALHRQLTGRRILGMFRGHDHVANGYRITRHSNGFTCTLNALGAGNTCAALINSKKALSLFLPTHP